MTGATVADLILQPCDILLTRNDGVVGRLIRWGTRGRVQHAGLMVTPSACVEAVPPKVLERDFLRAYQGTRTSVAIFRPLNLKDSQRDLIVAAARTYVGRPYGYAKIALHAADSILFGGAYCLRGLGSDRTGVDCDWVVSHAYRAAGLDFGVPDKAADPGAIWTFCDGHPDIYRPIHSLDPLEAT